MHAWLLLNEVGREYRVIKASCDRQTENFLEETDKSGENTVALDFGVYA